MTFSHILSTFKQNIAASISFLVFIIAFPVSVFWMMYTYQYLVPQDNVIGVGVVNTFADSAYIEVGLDSYISYPSSGYEVGSSDEAMLKKTSDKIIESILALGVTKDRIVQVYGSNTGYVTNKIVIKGFTPESFAQVETIRKQVQTAYPKATISARYVYAITPEIRLAALKAGLEDAKRQAEIIAKDQHRSIGRFNGSLCALQVIDAYQMFNPATCGDSTYSYASTDSAPEKKVYGIVSANVVFSFFR